MRRTRRNTTAASSICGRTRIPNCSRAWPRPGRGSRSSIARLADLRLTQGRSCRLRLRGGSGRDVEILRQDQLEHEVVGPGCEAKADTGFDVHRFAVPVHHRVQLMRLLARGQEALELAEIIVLLGGERPRDRKSVV